MLLFKLLTRLFRYRIDKFTCSQIFQIVFIEFLPLTLVSKRRHLNENLEFYKYNKTLALSTALNTVHINSDKLSFE